jgi:hypothetical protein
MTPKIPYELAQARTQRDAAWDMYGKAIDDGKPQDAKERLGGVAEIWDAVCQKFYDRWQKLGGTSDIDSIEIAERIALAYGDADLGRHVIISGGEVMEL